MSHSYYRDVAVPVPGRRDREAQLENQRVAPTLLPFRVFMSASHGNANELRSYIGIFGKLDRGVPMTYQSWPLNPFWFLTSFMSRARVPENPPDLRMLHREIKASERPASLSRDFATSCARSSRAVLLDATPEGSYAPDDGSCCLVTLRIAICRRLNLW